MYRMFLIANGREIEFPVLPEKLDIKSNGKNDRVTVLGLGEVLILRKKALRELSFESLFPAHNGPFVSGGVITPIEAVKAIQDARDAQEPVRFLLSGTDLDINTEMGVESFSYDEHFGEVGDIYYSIKLSEWKNYAAKRIVLPEPEEEAEATIEEVRAGEPPVPKSQSYTVVKGDCLWAIAKRLYGDGSQYTKIRDANSAIIAKHKGGPNMIWPGDVLIIP